MSGINDNVKLLYDALKKEGYGNLGSVEQFDGLLKDSGNREYLYKSMKDEGFSDLGEYSEFESMLGYQMPEDLKQSKGVLRSDINPEPVNLRPEYTGPTQEQPDYVNPLTNSPEYNFESIKQKGKIETVTPNDPYENIFQSISDNRTGLDDAIKEAMKGNVREGVRPIDVSTNLIAARDYLNEAEELINAKKEGAGLFRGIANAFTNRRTWDFGMSDFATNKSVKNAIDKFEKGDELSDDETRLLDALAVNTAAKVYASDMGYGYDIGSGFVQSIPFMIEMAINPLSGSGKAIGKKLASYAAKRFARNAGNILGKVGRVAGDVAGSTAMAATTGAPGVAADYYARSTGTPVVSSDFGDISLGQVAMDPFGNVIKNENGENMMIGSVGKESDAKAMYKALAARSIDNFSEMFGAYFGPIGDAIKNSRLGKRLSVSAVGKKLDQLTTEDWVKSFNSLLKDAKYDGFIGETAEEYVGGLINSVMVGDQSLSDLASLDNLIRTAGTVGLMSGIFGSVNLAGVRTAKYKAGRDLENSENRIFNSVGEEEFDDFINKMDSSDPDKRADIIRDIIKSDKYDNIQKAMFMDYYHKRMVYDGFVYGQAKKNQEGKPTEDDQEATVEAETSQSNMSQGRQSFEQMSEESKNVGRNMTSRDEMYAASNDMKAKRNDLESMDSGLAQTIDNYVENGASYGEVIGLMDGLPADLRSKAEAYYQSQMVVTGAKEKVRNDIDQKVKQVESEVTPYIKKTEDGRRVFTTANFDEGLYHGPVYVMEDDGNYAVIYQEGQQRMVDSARLSDKKDNDLDTVLADMRDQMIASSKREMDLYLYHHPKTRYPEPGLVVFNGKNAFILQGQDEKGDWSAFPAVFDKETGQVTAKANGTPSLLTEREILELQDNAYASQDIPVNEQVQQEQQPEQTIKTSEIEGENATSPSSGESNVSQETPQSDLDRVIASLPKKDDGSIDYKSMSPSQQYDYTSLTESPETALSDLQQDVEAKKKEVEDIEAKIAKATGGERAELRDQARAKRKEYEELTAFYNSVAPAPVPAEIQQEVQEPVQAVEKQEVKQEKPIETEKSKTTEKKTDKNNEVDNYLGLEEVGAPLNAHELAAKMMANGSIRLTRDSYMKETGFGEEEAKKMFGLFYKPENGGVSVERAGEILTQADSEGGYNFIDPNEPNAARDVIIDVLSQAKTRGDLINYIKRRREDMANRERQAAYNDYAKWTQDNFGMTPEEWEAYNDAVDRDIRSIGITDEELRAIDGGIYDDMLAEQQDYAEIYGQLNQQQDETNQGNEQGRDQEPGEGGGEVLPTEQPVETGRDGVVEGERPVDNNINSENAGAQEGASGEIKPIGKGPFGNIYDQFRGKVKEAINFLRNIRDGEAIGALYHKDIGDISLVWGNDKAGLKKILKKHPEVSNDLQGILDGMNVVEESDNRIKLESPTHFAVVSKEFLGQPRDKWLLTAYEKKETPRLANSSMDVESNLNGKSDDTATRQNQDVSNNKIINNQEESQDKKNSNNEKPKNKKDNGLLSESDFIDKKVKEAFESRKDKKLTREEWEDTDDFDNAFNQASDSYPDYIKQLKDNGDLQLFYDNGSIGDRIKIREAIETAGFNFDDYVDASKEKEEAKRKREEKRQKRQKEIMIRIGLLDENGSTRYSIGEIAYTDMTDEQRAVYDSVVGMLEDAGIQVEVLTDDQMKDLADNNEITLEAKRKSEARKDKDRVNGFIDEAISMVTGKSVKDVRSDRLRREQERRDKAKKIYDSVLDNDFNDVTLRLINEYIDEATPNNPYGRRISQRVPQKMERRLHEGNRTNAIDALFTRISESAVGKAGEKLEGNRGSRERAKEKKKELLKGWAIATGNWHTDISDFTNDKEPVARGKDSDVYYSKDGEYVIKFSKGKEGNRFPSDIDAPNLFSYIFPNSAYDILGYGEIDGNFVTILRQPIVEIESALTEDERVEYMRSLGFDPINKDNTAFSNGEVIVADLQKGNVVRTKEGNVRVIDADVKLHTKDLGGKYSYPPVDVDTENRINLFKDNNGIIYGATIGGKIYLNGSALNPETPIHEYTHIWDEACRRNNPELWNRGVDLMRQTSVWNDVKNDPNYSNLETDDEIASEVHSRLTGKDGARILEEMVDSSNKQDTSDLREKLKKWLDDFWWWLKDTMMPWTKNEVSRVTLNDFVNMPLKDLANGKRINQENNTVRFRFIGERGAYNLDQAEEATTRMDNLNVARNMEKANNEKKMRIEKLKTSNPVEITGDEIEPSDDLKQYKKNALEYGKRLRGEYTNKDTGVTVILSSGNKNGGLKEVLQHDINDIDHLKSVAAIPGILENSIYIETVDNEEVDKNPNVARYHYYVCGLKIGDTDYTVKAVVAEQNNGNRYYDHKLTEIEKGKLLDELAQLNQTSPSGLSSTGELEETEQSRPAASRGGTQSSPVSKYKDTRLMSILQTDDRENAKKIKLATGWERGADGKWRYETPDFSFKENPVVVPFDGYVLTNLGALINDEELFKAYPELEDMTVQYQNLPLGMLASYSPKTNRFPAMITMDDEFIRKKENPEWRKLVEKMEQEPVIKKWIEEMKREPFDETLYNKAEKDFKESPLWEKYNDLLLGKGKVPRYVSGFSGEKILAHEIQHAIQDIEGFAKGGNTRNTQYNNFAGEVESRNVEKRFDLSPEGRSATLAEETEDVAREDQIFINNALNNNKSLFYEPNTRNNQSKEARPEANREDSRARTETVEANGNFGAQDNTPVGSTGRETAEANDGVYNGDRVNGQQTGNYDRASDQGTGRENRPANGDIDGQDGQRAVGYDAGRGEQGQRDIDSGRGNNLGNIQPGDNRGATDNGDRGTNDVDQRVDGEGDRAGDIDQGRDRFIRAANETARSLGTTVRIINNIDELPDSAVKEALSQGRKITGWYDIPSGQVYVYAPNLTSENEAKKTVLHEAVAHKGLRQVIGNDAYNKEMVKLFDKLPEDEKIEVSRMAQERYGGDTAVAMDEYLAEKAELDETPSFWEKVVSSVRRMLRKVGIDMSLNEGDVKYLLWRGRKSLNEKDPFEVAKDLVMRSRNGIGQKGQTRMREARTEVEQSSPTGGSTTKAWDDLVSSDAYLMEESLFDYLLSVDKFQKLITGKDKSKVLDYENAYHALLQVSSVNRSEMDIFDASLLSSLNEAISKLVGKRKRKWKWESGPERDLVKYVEAKHGIERNRDLAVRDGMASLREMPLERLVSSGIMSKEEYKSFSDKVEKEADEEARKFKDRIMPQILKRESRKEGMTEEGAREIAEKESERRAAKVKNTYIKKAEAELKEDKIKSINDRWVRGRVEIRSKNMSWENKQKSLDNLAKSLSWKDKFGSFGVKWGKDYSGLSSVFKDDADKENTGWDERAREFVKSYEESHDQESIKGLWDSVKKITDFSLWKQRQSGLVDQQYVNDNMDRFEYFVPLRGFKDEIAADVYQYFSESQSLASNPVKKANQRITEADNPFAGMLSVAYASIASGNKNITKQKFLNFVRNHDTDGLVTVNNIWIRNVGTEENPDWQEVAPEIPDNATSEEVAKAVNDFEAQMEELAEQGLAEKIKGGKSRIPYKTLGRQRNEHQVQVLVGGNRYVLTVNGNPRVAQAINGLMNPDVNMNGFFEYGKRVQVFMAGMFTSKNVAFSMVNLTRDLSYSNVMTFINEDFGYFTTFTKNQAKLVKDLPKIGKMLYDYNRGELDPKDKLSTYFKEFMDNGGATGYTFIESQREYSGKLAKMLDRLSEGNLSNMNPAKWTRLMFDMFEFMGNTTEILNRLAAYETSREKGRSVSRSIMDAKEVTVNFSRKGAGIKSVNKDTRLLPRLVAYTSQFGRSYILFWNASLQGKRKLLKSAMNHPIKTGSAFVAAPICMGMAVPLLNNVFLPALYNMVGLGSDDDKEDYFDVLSDWQRQSNICIRLPKGYWLKLPLSPDIANFYGLGDKIHAHLAGKRDLTIMDGVETIVDTVSPIGINWNYQGTALALNVLPTVFQPLAQTMMNTNFMGNPIKKESFTRSSELDPEYTKVYKSASSSLVELSKLTNDLSGGDAIRSGSVNWNPAILQNLLTGYTGGFGTVALGVADAIVDASKGDTQGISATRYPLLSRFVAGGDPEVKKRRINSNYQTVVVDFVNKIMHDYDGYQKKLEDPTLNELDYAEYYTKMGKIESSEDFMKAMDLQNYIDQITDINKTLKEFGDDELLESEMYELMLEAIDIKRDKK